MVTTPATSAATPITPSVEGHSRSVTPAIDAATSGARPRMSG